jgi:hypothetical protein
MLLPAKRPASYLLGFLLIILVVLVVWMDHTLTSPEIQDAIRKKRESQPAQSPVDPVMTNDVQPRGGAAVNALDPMHQAMADELHAETTTPERDLEIIRDFVSIYSRASGGNPVGDNADITAALTGTQYPGQKGHFFPRGHSAVRSGQLVDRWGSPYWFHPNSSSQMEIRSAGPDRQLFTGDDQVLNPSPSGLGVTAPAAP